MAAAYKYGVFAAILRSAMSDHGVTQELLAAQLGLEQQAVSKWTTGQTRPKPGTLNKLIEIFDWDPAEILVAMEPTPAASSSSQKATVVGRLRALELRVDEQDRKLEAILAILREWPAPQ